MGLFDRKKEAKSCCCGAGFDPEAMAQAQTARAENGVKVLGSGCAKCRALEEAARAALAELHMDLSLIHISEPTRH